MTAIEIIFWISFFTIFHSYVAFPIILKLFASGKKNNSNTYQNEDKDLPSVAIILAAFNESTVIRNKILSTFNTTYPLDKIEFLIGSDASNDGTDTIIEEFGTEFHNLKLYRFLTRTGKTGIINDLIQKTDNTIIILTDANVFFNPDTIFNLVKHFKNQEIAVVGGNILNTGLKADGISIQEFSYLKRENEIKLHEGLIWGKMMGGFGGCYAIRKENYHLVPNHVLVDDFYITMAALEQNKKAIFEPDAICYEDISNKISEEFRRKIRISIGNFQNLNRFKKLLFPLFTGIAFSFFSHKVLRWFGPIFIITSIVSSGLLSSISSFYYYIFLLHILLISIPFIDFFIRKLSVNFKLFRFITHFYVMNLALFVGMLKYLKGSEEKFWKPTERNQ